MAMGDQGRYAGPGSGYTLGHMALSSEQDIQEFLDGNPDWSREGDVISRTFEFEDFVGSIGFVAEVALLAEKANHHPDIDIRWNKVTLALSTHSEGGITAKDLELAVRSNAVA
jgi:4a-hydroxytetrahydrobiopterin dehydratase